MKGLWKQMKRRAYVCVCGAGGGWLLLSAEDERKRAQTETEAFVRHHRPLVGSHQPLRLSPFSPLRPLRLPLAANRGRMSP